MLRFGAYALLCRLLAPELLADFYRGLLGREPDAEGLMAYVKELRRENDVPLILRDMSRSPEALHPRAMDITPEDVRWCYRELLGRDAESGEVVERRHKTTPDFRALVKGFVEGAEYANLMAAARRLSEGEQRFPLELPAEDIESRCSPAELEAAWDRVRETWEQLGALSPHHSVLTDERFGPERFTEHAEAFWASGDDEAKELIGVLRRHGVDERDLAGMDCLELGCGVGRASFPLAERFRRVEGWDISSTHLALARERKALVGRENVEFRPYSGPPRTQLGPCDVFYSKRVLQHNPPPIIRELVGAALTALKPGGTAFFQLPSHIPGYRFSLSEWLSWEAKTAMEMHCLPQEELFAVIAESGCRLLEVREESDPTAPIQFISNFFVVRRPG